MPDAPRRIYCEVDEDVYLKYSTIKHGLRGQLLSTLVQHVISSMDEHGRLPDKIKIEINVNDLIQTM